MAEAGPSRGRGRGRGRGQPGGRGSAPVAGSSRSLGGLDGDVDETAMAFVPAPIQQLASSSAAAPDVQAMLRGDSDYVKSGATKIKYVPRKYVPKAKVECVLSRS